MGVHGLWNLLEPSGKAVPLETLENKILAVDVSIWLHQVVKGFQDSRGNPVPNAHLLGLFHRICKLLFYKIKPVFVFDGGVPFLKKQTVAARQQKKSKAETDAERLREKILTNLIKHKVINSALGNSTENDVSVQKPTDKDDMFVLPALAEYEEEGSRSEMEYSSTSDDEPSPTKLAHKNLHSVDVKSERFKSLPADVRHEILTELRETRKESSWGRLHEMPKDSGDFSSFQMGRLLKRRTVQVSLEQAEKEMGGHTLSLREMEEMLKERGVDTSLNLGSRIASDNVTRFIYVKDTGNTATSSENSEKVLEIGKVETSETKKDLFEVTHDQDIDSINSDSEIPHAGEKSDFESDWVSDEDFDGDTTVGEKQSLSLAKNFMFENSGLTQKQILKIIQAQIRKEKAELSRLSVKSGKTISDINHQPSTSKSALESNKLLSQEETSDINPQPSTSKSALKTDKLLFQEETSDLSPQPSTSKSALESYNLLSQEGSKLTSKNSDISKAEHKISTVLDMKVLEDSEKELSVINTQCISEENSAAKEEHKSEAIEVSSELNVNETGISIDICSTSVHPQDTMPGKDFGDKGETSVNLKAEFASEKKPTDNNERSIDVPVCEEFSDSELDFVEINSNGSAAQSLSVMKEKTLFQVVIKKDDCSLEDDIFADVFTKPAESTESTQNKYNSSGYDESRLFVENALNGSFEMEKRDSKYKSYSNTEERNSKNGKLGVVSKSATPASIKSNIELSEERFSSTDAKFLDSRQEDADTKCSEEGFFSTNLKLLDDVSEGTAVKHSMGTINEVVQSDVMKTEKLQMMKDSLEKEQNVLLSEKGRQERLATSISEQMNVEAQELLQHFGVPYVIAPMEAEAQCAFLDAVSLTDGTITDDSDIWLFGGQTVYKNFFNQKKHVLQFKAAEIQRYFRLTRRQLIVLALLVGSDYTTGLPGVGPVTALEIISAFPCGSEETVEAITRGLRKFREWVVTGRASGHGKITLKNKLKDIRLTEGFPNTAVVEAYVFPQIDNSKETFTWSVPDVSALRNYAREKFGWTQMKTDEIILPVLKKINERNVQNTIENYFKVKPIFRPVEGKLSKRVQKAINRIDGDESSSEIEEPKPKRKPRIGNVSGKKKREPNSEPAVCLQEPSTSSTIVQVGGRRGVKTAGRGKVTKTSIQASKKSGEFILQREKDKVNSLKSKLRAIELYRTSKLENRQKSARTKPKELKEANLSESSSDD